MAGDVALIRIGVSGWRYAPWRGRFYPRDLPQRAELAYAARRFSAIELNGSFYSLQRPQSYAQWYRDTPGGFVFAVKGGRFITHMLKLRGIEQPLANFFASGLFNLNEKLGPILWQFPASFRYEQARARLEPFLELLPKTTLAALALARKRSRRMQGRVRLAIDRVRPLRHAIEVRHESFRDPSFLELLAAHGVALVFTEGAGRWPLLSAITADFVYLRLHGDKHLYRSGYSDAALERWAERIRGWHFDPGRGVSRDVYCFFDNTDDKLRAPRDAQTLARKLGLGPACAPSSRAALRAQPGASASRPVIATD